MTTRLHCERCGAQTTEPHECDPVPRPRPVPTEDDRAKVTAFLNERYGTKERAVSKIDDGGPAFPCHTNPLPGKLANAPQGMSLRDYFAGLAIQGMSAAEWSADMSTAKVARLAYDQADAMLFVRKQTPEPANAD